MPLQIVLLGCPGAGKGTQAKALTERFGFAHVATGDLFRAEIAAKSDLGLKVQDYLKNGTLVPDAIVGEVVASKLDQVGPSAGFMLDGFPRTAEQARALDAYLKRSNVLLDGVLYLDLPPGEVLSRLTSRRTCPKCNAVYNVLSSPPKVDGKCDQCGGDLVQRVDDTEATVKKRLMVYEDLTRPLVAYYRAEGIFHEIDGARPVEDVTKDLVAAVESMGEGR